MVIPEMTTPTRRMAPTQFYPLSDVRFSLEEWNACQRILSQADRVFHQKAKKYHLKYRSSSRYPSKEIRKRVGFRTYQVSLVLRPSEKPGSPQMFDFGVGSWRCFLGLFYKSYGYKFIRSYAEHEIQDKEGLAIDVEAAIKNIGSE